MLLIALETLRAARWLDLTHAFAPGIAHYEGFADEQRDVVVDYPEGFRAHRFRFPGVMRRADRGAGGARAPSPRNA